MYYSGSLTEQSHVRVKNPGQVWEASRCSDKALTSYRSERIDTAVCMKQQTGTEVHNNNVVS